MTLRTQQNRDSVCTRRCLVAPEEIEEIISNRADEIGSARKAIIEGIRRDRTEIADELTNFVEHFELERQLTKRTKKKLDEFIVELWGKK